MERCETCKYWVRKPLDSMCRRYPTPVIHGAADWCGEYWSTEAEFVKLVEQSSVSPDIPKIPTDSLFPSSGLVGIEDAQAPVEPKPRQRRRKNNG